MNMLDLFLKASILVKLIMLILVCFSVASWAIIIQRTKVLNAATREAEAFEDKFWSGIELSRLYQESQAAVRTSPAQNRSSIPVSKSSPVCTAQTAMRQSLLLKVLPVQCVSLSIVRWNLLKCTFHSSAPWVPSVRTSVCLVRSGASCTPSLA